MAWRGKVPSSLHQVAYRAVGVQAFGQGGGGIQGGVLPLPLWSSAILIHLWTQAPGAGQVPSLFTSHSQRPAIITFSLEGTMPQTGAMRQHATTETCRTFGRIPH